MAKTHSKYDGQNMHVKISMLLSIKYLVHNIVSFIKEQYLLRFSKLVVSMKNGHKLYKF